MNERSFYLALYYETCLVNSEAGLNLKFEAYYSAKIWKAVNLQKAVHDFHAIRSNTRGPFDNALAKEKWVARILLLL